MNVPIASREFHEDDSNPGGGAGSGAAVSLLAGLSLGSTPLGSAGQVGILVPDLDKAIDLYGCLFGIDEWQCYRYDQDFMPWSRLGQEDGRFEMDIAMGGANPQIELIQPLAGPSIYHEFTAQDRMGLHHLGVFVNSLDAAISLMAGAGYRVTQTARGYGAAGDGGFAYFDTDSALGVVIEAIEIPATRRPGIVRRTGGM